MKDNIKKELPNDWKWTKLEEMCEIISGKNQSKVINPRGKYPIYGSSGIFGYADKYLCNEGTTVVGRKGTINSPLYVNTKFWNVDTAFGLSPNNKYDNKLLFYFCLSFNFHKLDKSTTIPSLAKRDLLSIELPLPPKPTQLAIVSKIEELFSELDKGIENLRLAQQQLKTYRQSVLKWAFEGKYSKGVEKWKNMTMKEASLKIVVGYVGPVTQHIVRSGGVKFLSTTHIGENEFLNHDIREISNAFNECSKKSQVIPGDIIIARHGDSGKACMIPDWIKIAQVSNAVILRPNPEVALAVFICYRLNAERQRIQKMKVGGVFQVVNTKSMELFQTLVPPIEEQYNIIQEIESRLSVADKMEESITQSLEQAEALRQSILKKAFDGRLI